MRASFIIVDVLVNASGAIMILLFLFIVRISPATVKEPPRFPSGSLLQVTIFAPPKYLKETVALLKQVSPQPLATYKIRGNNTPLFEDLTKPEAINRSLLGTAGGTSTVINGLPAVVAFVPCPRSGSSWQLSIINRLLGGADTLDLNKPSETNPFVIVEYLGATNGRLDPEDPGVNAGTKLEVQTLFKTIQWDMKWSIENGTDCISG